MSKIANILIGTSMLKLTDVDRVEYDKETDRLVFIGTDNITETAVFARNVVYYQTAPTPTQDNNEDA